MKKLGKNLLRIMPFMLVFAGAALFAADSLNPDAAKVIKGGIEDSKVAGGGFIYIFNAYVPLGLIIGGMVWGIGSEWAKKQPTDGWGKILMNGLAGGVVAYIIAGILWVLIGMGVSGNPVNGPIMSYHYWSGAMKAAAGDDVFTKVNN